MLPASCCADSCWAAVPPEIPFACSAIARKADNDSAGGWSESRVVLPVTVATYAFATVKYSRSNFACFSSSGSAHPLSTPAAMHAVATQAVRSPVREAFASEMSVRGEKRFEKRFVIG